MTERKDENMERIDKALEGLDRHDAPEHLVQGTLKRVSEAQAADHVPNRFRDRNWASGLAAAVVVVAALGVGYKQFGSQDDVMSPESYFETLENQNVEDEGAYRFANDQEAESTRPQPVAPYIQSSEASTGEDSELDGEIDRDEYMVAGDELAVVGGKLEGSRESEEGWEEKGQAGFADAVQESTPRRDSQVAGGPVLAAPMLKAPASEPTPRQKIAQAEQSAVQPEAATEDYSRTDAASTSRSERARDATRGNVSDGNEKGADARVPDNIGTLDQLLMEVQRSITTEGRVADEKETDFRHARDHQQKLLADQRAEAVREEERSKRLLELFEANEQELAELEATLGESANSATDLGYIMDRKAQAESAEVKPDPAAQPEKRAEVYEGDRFTVTGSLPRVSGALFAQAEVLAFLAGYTQLQGLEFQPADGYWSNIYLPGDPAMRRLEAQLQTQYPQALDTTFEPNVQPFDAPDNAALAVFLHGTQMAVEGPTRLQLQVGLRTAESQGGHRPPMNVSVVLDVPAEVDTTTAQNIRAILLALNEQRQTGDRFSVTLSSERGGAAIEPSEFRHGTIESLVRQLADDNVSGEALNINAAFTSAVDNLAATDDPTTVLGSSLLMLVTADGIEQDFRAQLTTLAHQSAIAGMPVSLVTLSGVSGSDLEPIVLAGQGRLRAIGAPADATQLVDQELHSASRTVARAIRLRIRLADDVRLVKVLGSRRLDEIYAQRVREAEQSIDQRMSRNWGIEADRGEDEDGIQIVIPSMAAGESHVVLLDVVVDGPGPVADVQVRYKDLAQMSNGVARASLALGEAGTSRHVQGPLERNVLKNLVASETARALRQASKLVAEGDGGGAILELIHARSLVYGSRLTVPGWENDPELLADEKRLIELVDALHYGDASNELLMVALEYAAYRKLLPAALNED